MKSLTLLKYHFEKLDFTNFVTGYQCQLNVLINIVKLKFRRLICLKILMKFY